MNKALLPVMIAGLLACAGAHCSAADAATAYTALRVMGKSLGEDSISRVVEVTGRSGKPQPQSWRIVILDGAKGAREVMVEGGRVVSQKTVVSSSLKPIRLQDLNLDSSGAFDAADKEARKVKVPFTAVDYALRVNTATGKPVWDLALFNADRARVGGVQLAAHDGNLIAVNGLNSTQQPSTTTVRPLASTRDADRDHDTVRPTRVTPSGRGTTTTTTTTYNTVRTVPPPDEDNTERRGTSSSGEGGFFSRAGRTLDHTTDAVGDTFNRTGQAINRTTRRTGAKIQRFFTGGDSDSRDGSRD